MKEDGRFVMVGIQPGVPQAAEPKKRSLKGKPVLSAVLLGMILMGCLLGGWGGDPGYMDLEHCSLAPCWAFPFGTDTLGRDIFSMIWRGGRISLSIGFLSTVISTSLAVVLGALSGVAPDWLDRLMMRLTEIFLSVPSLLVVVLIQAIWGEAGVVSISTAIGVTSWASMAKVVRSEVRQLRSSGYLIAARCMGGGFFHLLWRHLLPNVLPAILFMVIMNVRSAIAAESTLSFMGIGLPLEVISWGSMLSLSERALAGRYWWMILIPGLFLVTALMCVTNIGNYLRRSAGRGQRSL